MERLQRYDLLERIAAGGMGEVFRAQVRGEHGFQKTVAVKRVLPELARDPEFVMRFVAEAKLAVALNHANVVQVFDLARADDALFLVMEFVDGADLGQLAAAAAARGEPTPVALAVHLAIKALEGLAYAHERATGEKVGVVHCDISPSNLLVSLAGELKITDFGVAQVLNLARRGAASRVMGKPRYMAPEQQRGEPLDARADLYSLAVVLHELLTQTRAGDGPAVRLAEARPDVPAALDELVASAMAADAAERPASARVMLSRLSTIARALDPVTALDVGTWVRDLLAPPPAATAAGDEKADFDRALRSVLRPLAAAAARTGTASGAPPPAPAPPTATFVSRRAADGTAVWEVARPRRRWAVALAGGAALSAIAGVAVWQVLTHAAVAATPPLVVAAAPAPEPPAVPGEVAPPPAPPAPALATTTTTATATAETVKRPRPVERPIVAAAPAIRKGGFLNVYAEPWAYVFLDGRKVGVTPLKALAVPAGSHQVRLENPAVKPVQRTVHVNPDETQLLDVDLQ